MTTMPDDVLYGKVAGRFILAIGDGSDPDSLPDAVPASGYVTFLSALDNFNVETPDPTSVVPYRVRCSFDEDGYLIDPDGNLGVWLVAGVYTVFYTLENGEIDKHVIEVTTDHTNDTPLELPNAIPPGGPVLTVSEYTELSARIDALSFASIADLDDEVDARIAGDSALDVRVEALETAVPDLSAYATDAELASEASTRASADAALDARVDTLEAVPPVDLTPYATNVDLASEASTRASADAALDARLDTVEAVDHSQFATDAELASETSARIAADNALDARVDTLEAGGSVDLSGYATDAELASEASARVSADNALDSRVDTLEAATSGYATDAELASEASTRAAADTALEAEIAGLDTGKAPVIHLHGKGDITDFIEGVQDVVGDLVVAAGGTYTDASAEVVFPTKFRGAWAALDVIGGITIGSTYPASLTNTGGWVIANTSDTLTYWPFNPIGGTAPIGSYVLDTGPMPAGGPPGVWERSTFVVPAGVEYVRFKAALVNSGDPVNMAIAAEINGTKVLEADPTATWTTYTVAVTPGDTFGLAAYSAWDAGRARFGQIEFLASSDPYMVGQHVTHLNRLWVSDTSNNTGTPGTSGWTESQLKVDAADIADSTATGRSLITAADAAAVRSAAGVTVYDTETAQDVVGAMVAAAGGSYNDTAGTVTFPSGLDAEAVDDRIAALVTEGQGIDVVYNDAGNAMSISATKIFRGAWTALEVLQTIDLSAGVPAFFTAITAGWVTVSNPGGTGAPTGTNVMQGTANTSSRTAAFTVPAGVSKIRVKVKANSNFGMQNASTMQVGIIGGLYLSSTGGYVANTWYQLEKTVSPGQTDQGIYVYATYNDGVVGQFGQIELLGAANPYMTGHTVVYNGKLYISGVDNNASTPGTNGDWTLLPITVASTDVTDFTEASQDVVGALVAAAGGSYDDTAGTITLPGGADTEAVQDIIGAMIAAAGGSYNDTAGTITLPGGGASTTPAWTAWTPTFAGATPPTLGSTGTATGQYMCIGPLIIFTFRIVFGTGATGGSGTFTINPPLPILASGHSGNGSGSAVSSSAVGTAIMTEAYGGLIAMMMPTTVGDPYVRSNVPSGMGTSGSSITATVIARLATDSGVGTNLGLGPTAWTNYTPDITASITNPTLGSGSLIKGRYRLNGNYVEGVIWITTGTSGAAAGSGAYSVSLPPGITADTSDAIIMSVGSFSHTTSNRTGSSCLVPSGAPGRLRATVASDWWGSANAAIANNQSISLSFAFALSAGGGLAGSAAHTHESTGITDFAEATQDVVGALVTAMGGAYDDAAATITLPDNALSGATVIDNFDNALRGDWVLVGGTGALTANANWLEKNGKLSHQTVATDTTGITRALMAPLSSYGGALAVGDAIITKFDMMMKSSASIVVVGIVAADGTTHSSGSQISAIAYRTAGGTLHQLTIESRSSINYGTTATDGTTTSLFVPSYTGYLRLVKTGASTWRTDYSPNGVQWILGTAMTFAVTPTHVGLLGASWGDAAGAIVTYDFIQRMAGVS